MMEIKISGRDAVKRFVGDQPEKEWLLIVRACLVEAERTGGEFAGAWALQEANKLGVEWVPNLRPLVAYGVLRKTGGSRGGRRAYYVIPDPEGVKRALEESGIF
jgi:hypothetical protein